MRRRTLSRDESTPLLTMEQTPPTKEKLDATTDDAVIIPVDDEDADLDAPLTPSRIKKLLEGLSSQKASERLLTDLCKIPLTMSIENLFPPVPVTEAPVPDESDHVLAFGCVDLGYAYVRDTKENVRRRSSRRSSVDVEAPSGAAAEGVA